jgi:hypothetical protein
MAIRIQVRRDTAANWTSNNPVLFPGEIGIEIDTRKFKIGPAVISPAVSTAWNSIANYANVVPSDLSNTLGDYILAADLGEPDGPAKLNIDGNLLIPEDSIIFEGSSADAHETTLTVTNPTEDRTITLPNATGTVALAENVAALSGATFTGNISVPTAITFEGATANDFETTIQVTDPTADRTITFPDAGGTVALTTNIPSTTDNLSEGSTNKYYTDERAQDAIATAIAAGTHTNITITYDDDNNKFTFVGANTYSDENAQDAVGNALGTGLSYNDTTGAISVDTTAIQARVADVSDTEIGYLNGVTSAIQTQLNDKAPISSPTFTGTVAGITKSMVGLGNVDNTTDANKPVSTATQTALDLKAPIASPTFTGTVTVPTPVNSTDAATKAYVDALGEGLHIHASVVAATTANINLATDVENGDVLDGVTLATGNRILVKNQSTASQNGIYVVAASGAPSRATDFDSPAEIDGGDFVFVTGGTANDNKGFVQVNTVGTVGTDPIEFTQFSGAGTFTAGNGLAINGSEFSINTGITADLTTAQTLTNKTLTTPTINGGEFTATGGTPRIHGIYLPEPHFITFEGATNNEFETVLTTVDPTADRTVSLPDATTTLVGKDTTDTLTNKTLTSPKINEDVAMLATATELNILDGATLSTTELNYVDGVTSAIQTQLNGKSATGHSHSASDVTDFTEAAQDAVGNSVGTGLSYNDTSGAISVDTATIQARVADVSDTEIGYLNGVTSGIQTQLDGKVDESLFDTKGDILVASADNTPVKLAAGTNGYLLTANSSATNGIEWAAAPVSLPSQSGESGKYLTTDGTTASWGTLVVPITTGTSTVSANTATTIDTTALSEFTSIEYMVSLKQGSKIRTSKVVVQTDGTSVDMTEFAITETGGTIAGVVVSAAVSSTNGVLQLTVTDATSTNVTVKFSKVKL